jgi:hypothetical protein
MEAQGSLPRSQEPSSSLYPEPDQSNPYHPISKNHFLTFHVPNLISIFLGLGRLSTEPVQVRGPV